MTKYKIGNPYWQIIGFLFFTIISINAFGQKDTTKQATWGRHIISIHETSDFFLSQYVYDTKRNGGYPYKYAYYSQYPFGGLRDFYDFSIGVKYEYKISRSIGVSSGLFFSRYAFDLANRVPIPYMDTVKYGYKYYVSFFYLPIGFDATFFNSGFIQPRLGFDLINAFLIYEKAEDRLYKQLFSIESDTLRYYFLKPQITLGCDFYIKKKYRIGIEMVWKGNAFYHTNKTMPYRFKYTNLCFGVNFGYVIK